MSVLSRLVVLLGADIGTFESDMGKAVRVAEQKSKQIERSAKGAGKAIGEIGHALQYANFGGLDKLTEGSKTATAAIKGLGASISLIGFASWPVLAITAVAGALGYFVTQGGQAEKQAEELADRLDKLRMSAVDLAAAPIRADASAAQGEMDKIRAKIAATRDQIAFLARNNPNEDIANNPVAQQLEREIEALEKEIPAWGVRFRGAIDKITEIKRRESERVNGPASKAANEADGVIKMASMTVGPSPALLAEIENIKLARKLAEEAKTPYDLLFERMQDIERAAIALDDTGNPILDPEAAQRLKDAALDEYMRKIAIGVGEIGVEADKAAKPMEKQARHLNVFADQAARNIQSITASLIKGEQTGRSFFSSMINGLRDVAAEILSQQLLTQLFGSFTGSGGFLGAFASAIVGAPGRATGGSVEAGKPYWVGERGEAEMFVPDVSGKVVPMGRGGSGGDVYDIKIDARAALDPGGIVRAGVMLERRILGAVAERQTRGITRGSNG